MNAITEPVEICSVHGCVRETWARKMCGAHLQRFYKDGNVMADKAIRQYGDGYIDKDGYRRVRAGKKEKPRHVLIVERVLGKALPAGAVVHHADRNRTNNDPTNLVVCPSSAYHNLIHQRLRALDACGHADWRRCCRCGQYDKPENIRISGSQAYHPECNREHARKMRGKS